jgi:hypothetical protein
VTVYPAFRFASPISTPLIDQSVPLIKVLVQFCSTVEPALNDSSESPPFGSFEIPRTRLCSAGVSFATQSGWC